VLDCSAQQCTNGAWCPRQTAVAEQRSKRPITYYLPVPCTILQMGRLVWRLSMVTLWTGFKQQHSASDDTIGSNEEEDNKMCKFSWFCFKKLSLKLINLWWNILKHMKILETNCLQTQSQLWSPTLNSCRYLTLKERQTSGLMNGWSRARTKVDHVNKVGDFCIVDAS